MSIKHERKPFVMVSKSFCEDDRFTASEKAVMLTLASFANNSTVDNRLAWPSRQKIMKRAKVSEATMTNAINKLVEYGYLEVIPKYRIENGKPTKERLPNDYLLKNV